VFTTAAGLDCDDRARSLQEYANLQGYIVSLEYEIKAYQAHLKCTAIAGDKLYFIEPATCEITDSVALD
jgi:hypothetical protein